MMRRRAVCVLPGLALVLATSFAHPLTTAAAPVTHTWPTGDCTTTLQACIDAAASGDVVLIDTDTPIDEPIRIQDKSLTLGPAAGRDPTLASTSLNQVALYVFASPAVAKAMQVEVDDLTVAGQVFVRWDNGSAHHLTLSNLRIHVPADAYAISGAALEYNAFVPSSLDWEGGDISGAIDQADGMTLDGQPTSGTISFRVVGVRVHLGGTTSSSGISLRGRGTGGTVRGHLYNNVLYKTATCNCGSSTSIEVLAANGTDVVADVVGNTVDRSGPGATGIGLYDNLPSGHHMTARVFNNVVSHVKGTGIWIAADQPSTFTWSAGYNDLYDLTDGNHFGGFGAGSNNLAVAPQFVNESAGNLALAAASPLINAGLTCSPGGVAGPDLAGNNRRFGKTVDIGAYERNAGAPGLVLLGTSGSQYLDGGPGSDILCGYSGADTLVGEEGADYLDGGGGADHLLGGPGNDRFYGRDGNDLLCARDGASGDYLDGGPGTDSYRANAGDTTISVEQLGDCSVF